MFKKLFGNPGEKLSILANITFCLWVIAGIVIGVMFAFISDDVIIMLPIGAVVGFIIGWLNGLVIHLFASIAENLDYINKNVYSINKNVYSVTDIIEENNEK